MKDYPHDVFISHASEDKESIAIPLYEALQRAGIKAWFDKEEIEWGNSIPERINNGLRNSRYVLVIASQAFINKNWTQAELNAVLSSDIRENKNRILVLMVGDSVTRQNFLSKFSLLGDKLYAEWKGQPDEIVEKLSKLIGKQPDKPTTTIESPAFNIPLPKIRRTATDFEKAQFLKQSFQTVRAYFKEGLSVLKAQQKEVETSLEDVDNSKFVSTVYWHGEQKCQCKVWLGNGGFAQNSILFSNNPQGVDIRNDNSLNESLSIDDSTDSLSLRAIMGMYSFANSGGSNKNSFTAEEAARYLWNQFVQPLSQRR